jgi:tight adherence protein C
MNEWMQLAALALVIVAVIFPAVLLLLRARQRRDADIASEDVKPELLFGTMTSALSEQLQVNQQTKAHLEKELRSAGFYRPTAFMEYSAVRAVLVLVPIIVTGIVALLVPDERMNNVLLWGALATGIGFSLPRIYVGWRGRVRNQQVERGLPLAIDLLTLSLTAGQNLLDALDEVARELRFTNPDLAQDLAIAHQQAKIHSLEYAMKQWSERIHVPDVTNLALLFIQSERLGTGAANALVEFGNYLRISMRQRAEAQANRTSFWMLFPSVFCFWIAAGIILIGPAYLDFAQQRERSASHLQQMKGNIQRANDRARNTPTQSTTSPTP